MKRLWTPGPWKTVMQFGAWMVRQNPKNWDGNGYQHICSLPAGKKGSHYGDMFAANARLIAAAPAMDSLLAKAADALNASPDDKHMKLGAKITDFRASLQNQK